MILISDALPETVLRSRADSTIKKYLGAFKRWKQWAIGHQLQDFPAATHHIVLYLQHIAQTTGLRAAMEEATYSLAWVHSKYSRYPVNPFVKDFGGRTEKDALETHYYRHA